MLHGYKQTGPMILSKMSKLLSKIFMERYDVVVAPDGPYVTIHLPRNTLMKTSTLPLIPLNSIRTFSMRIFVGPL